MRKFEVNKDSKQKLPTKEEMAKYKDFGRLSHEYDKLVKRPKVPLYKDKRMFLLLLIIILLAYLISEYA
ncbi:MAG: hypothetical protein MK078_09990 [Crocinitomicaceae bacterium]|nr:hypothetical protein [Crocinitomicaceae bacterium]